MIEREEKMKKLSMFFKVLLTLLLVFALLFAVQATAMAAGEATTADAAADALASIDWAFVLNVAEAVAVGILLFFVSYFKTSSTFKDFVAKLIDDAEERWEGTSGAGIKKMAEVVNLILLRIPAPLRALFPAEKIEAYVQTKFFDDIQSYAKKQCDKAVKAIEAKYDAAKAKKPKTAG